MMKFLKHITVVVLFLLNVAVAQTQPPNELDKQFTPDANSIFNSSGKNGKVKGGGHSVEIQNAIKFNPLLIPRSIFALFYERKIIDGLSLTGGLGFCYNTDKISGFFNSEDFTLGFGNTDKLSFSGILSNSTFDGGGPFLSAGVRIYTGGYFSAADNFNSGYFEINYRFTSVNLRLNPTINSNDKLAGDGTVNIRNSGFNLIYGYQLSTEGSIKTTHDFYLGTGIKSVRYDEFTRTLVDPNNGYSPSYYQCSPTGAKISQIRFMIIAGYAFGIGF